MEVSKRDWNEKQKRLEGLLKKEATYKEGIALFLEQHAMVHQRGVSNIDDTTFEDELWENMDEQSFREKQNKKGRTVAYGMWHSTRIEDITMNLLVAESEQVIDGYNYMEKIKSTIYDTGNALNRDEILKFSQTIDRDMLIAYRKQVGQRTREIVKGFNYLDLKRKVSPLGIQKIIELGAVSKDEKAVWLIDFWGKKTAAGILLMPCTRHLLVHINESIEAKNRK